MRTVAALTDALEAAADLVERVTPARLPLATPCPGWSVGDVIEHVMGVTGKFTAFAAGVTDRPQAPAGHPVDAAAFRTVTAAATAAWATADPGRTCRLSFGSFTAELAAGINLFDLLAHGWDIEAATGEPFGCPDSAWETGLWAARQVIGDDRDLRHFAPALPAGPNEPIRSRFLAYLGRDPR